MYARRIAMFALRDDQGRVVLQHRTKDAKVLADHWAFFGGWIQDGESPEQAVYREAVEEIQIELQHPTFFRRYEQMDIWGLCEKIMYTAPLMHSLEALRNMQREGDDVGLFDYQSTLGLKISENDRVVLRDIFEISR